MLFKIQPIPQTTYIYRLSRIASQILKSLIAYFKYFWYNLLEIKFLTYQSQKSLIAVNVFFIITYFSFYKQARSFTSVSRRSGRPQHFTELYCRAPSDFNSLVVKALRYIIFFSKPQSCRWTGLLLIKSYWLPFRLPLSFSWIPGNSTHGDS